MRPRLISRSVFREIWPPFLLGFAGYTFILLIRTIFMLADFAVRRSAPFWEVARLVLLSLPWIVVLTLPMAFLVGVLVGIGRLNTDSELVALRSCGVGPAALYRPVLGAAAAARRIRPVPLQRRPPARQRGPPGVHGPRGGHVHRQSRGAPHLSRAAPGDHLLLRPRPPPTADRSRASSSVSATTSEPPNRIIVARRGTLTLEGDRLWLDLFESTVHELDAADPARDRTSRNETQRLLLAGDTSAPAGSSVRVQRSLRSQTLPELWRAAHSLPQTDPGRRLAWVEIHKKFAIPVACLAFALVGVPLAQTLRRGGRGGSFALSLAVLLGYYLLLSSGETWAQEGRMAPALAMWLPNLVLVLIGVAAALWRPGGRTPRLPRPPISERGPAAAPAPSVARAASPRPRLGLVSLLDRYVLSRFLSALLLVFGSALLLAVVVDYADKLDEVARHHPSAGVVFGYYRYFVLSIAVQIAPFAVLLAILVGLGVLSKNAEDTAFKASGVSLLRLALPVFAITGLFAVLMFTIGEYVLPLAEQRQARLRNVIYGRSPDYGIRTSAERNWYLSRDGSIWFREEAAPSGNSLLGVAIFRFGPGFTLARRTDAREAVWTGGQWTLEEGWTRAFEADGSPSYRRFDRERIAGDPPTSIVATRRRPEEMRFRELERLTRHLRAGGYPTAGLETALQAKLAQPALLPVMVLLAVPFAFRVGRRGALAGIGLGLGLGILTLVASAFVTKLGEVGALPPPLAAWSPNVFFALTATYFLIRLRT